ncbi:hypothetical protein Ahy_A02g006137 [Arachis hypogaea]|uniref:Uncharacterized protein n=1 Tax=Arachis hypogaea TaxID=3818 RepID=A0A445E919_ARAHY|nr:hypothetical protein Ahy_A02g006137 [Arachis hypogaea]
MAFLVTTKIEQHLRIYIILSSFNSFDLQTGIEPAFVLYFDCSVEEMERRLLNRNQAREDDKIETIKKQFKIFLDYFYPPKF